MEMISDILNQTEGKKRKLSRAMLTLLSELKEFRNHVSLSQKGLQETYTEQASRENKLEIIQESITKRLQEVEQKEMELELKEEKLDLLQKEVKVREERLLEKEKLIEQCLEMSRKRSEGMTLTTMVDEGVEQMSLKRKSVNTSVVGHHSKGKEIETKKLKEREEELEFEEIYLNIVKNCQTQVGLTSGDALKNVRDLGYSCTREKGSTSKNRCEEGSKGPEMSEIIEIEDDLEESDEDVIEQNPNGAMIYSCSRPEFNDFDLEKQKNCFFAGQIWALYDTKDCMPRFYAKIKQVFKKHGFKLRLTWLEADPENKDEVEWVNKELPYSCGRFRHGNSSCVSENLAFSHQVQCENNSKNQLHFMIYPKKGEIWAVFHEWDVEIWMSGTKFKYAIVEILSDYAEDSGVGIAYLNKVNGFVSIFHRTPTLGEMMMIRPNERLKFSHKIPSFEMLGKEKGGVPIGSFELDPHSLPINSEDIWYPLKVKEEEEEENNTRGWIME